MITNINNITDKVANISQKILDIYQSNLKHDSAKLREVRIEILNLAKDTTIFLNKSDSLTSWQKMQIVKAINAFNWNWLYLALNRIQLSTSEANLISPDIVYDKEITELSFLGIIEYIDSLKTNL